MFLILQVVMLKKTGMMMKKKKGNNRSRSGSLKMMFRGIAEGDIKTLAIKDTNVSSLRTIAASLNTETGYQKYRVSVDSLYGVVRIANDV